MSEPVSRQELEELVAYRKVLVVTDHGGNIWPEGESVFNAARAILDAPPVDWCEVHGAGVLEPATATRHARCQNWGRPNDPCQFQTYVRVKVKE